LQWDPNARKECFALFRGVGSYTSPGNKTDRRIDSPQTDRRTCSLKINKTKASSFHDCSDELDDAFITDLRMTEGIGKLVADALQSVALKLIGRNHRP